MNLIDLKERVVLSPQFTPEERNFILEAINSTIDWQQQDGRIIVHDPGNTLGRLDHLYAFLSVDSGGEGICGINNIPLVAASPRLVEKVKGQVRQLAKATNKVIRLAKFGSRADIETFRP